MSETTNNYTLIGFFEALTLIFVIVKITGYVTWSWLWVFSPVIVQVGLVILILIVALIVAIIKALLD